MDDVKLILGGRKLKRDDGCDYCNSISSYGFNRDIYGKGGIFLEVVEEHLHLEVDQYDYIVEKIPINNCPMCGRKFSSK